MNREWSTKGIPLLPVNRVAEDGRLVKGEARGEGGGLADFGLTL